MMEAALLSRSAEQGALRARNAELAGQLRAAAMQGDDAHIRRLLSELLRFQGLTKGQRVSLQLKSLVNLVQALRCVALTDDLTGLCNWRGFMRTATRLLVVAARDMRDLFPSYGVYEVIGRLNGAQFAALTTSPEYASRSAILLRARRPQTRSSDLPGLSLSVGVAHFNSRRPVGIDELLTGAKQATHEHRRATQFASSEMTPHTV